MSKREHEDATPLFEAQDLVRDYGRRRVVDHVSLEVSAGEIVGLLGPNGAGKTTTFRMALGLLPPHGGRVLFHGHEVSHLPVHRRARLGMGYLAQDPSIFRSMTVEENLLAVLEWMPEIPRSERGDRALDLLDDLNLGKLARQRAGSLSGGEQRRLEIARVLASDPELILLDEPFANIDPITVQEVQEILRRLRERGIGILLTDHNVRETLSITDHSYILVAGQVFREGKARDLVDDPMVRKTYLGENFRMADL